MKLGGKYSRIIPRIISPKISTSAPIPNFEDIRSFFFLSQVIDEPKPRSKKWISTSYLESDLNTDQCRYFSAEYLTNNLLKTVLFKESTSRIPENAIVIEIAPDGVLQSILTRSLRKNTTSIATISKNSPEPLTYFLSSVGR